MSRENLELVTRALAAVTEQPKPDYETVNALFHPDHVLVSVQAGMLGEGEARGGDGYRAWLASIDAVTPYTMELEGALDIGPDMVLAVATVHIRGASSGADMEQRMWYVVTVSDGQIIRTEAFVDPAQVLEVASRGPSAGERPQ